MYKITDGLVSGRYSVPRMHAGASSIATQKPGFQEGIRPMMFKNIIGKGHAEFSTMRQQDSEEFLTHLVQTLRRMLHKFKSQGIGKSCTPRDPSSPLLTLIQCTHRCPGSDDNIFLCVRTTSAMRGLQKSALCY